PRRVLCYKAVAAPGAFRLAKGGRPMPRPHRLPALLIGIAAVLLTVAPGLRADVSPGETIDKSRLAEARPLISPSIEWILDREAPMSVERPFRIGESRRLYYNGRLVVDPKPEMPNDSSYRFQEFVGPILAPYDLKGVGLLTYRYIDPAKPDASFLYLPVLRRVRRLSTAQRSDAILGTDADPDSFWGYAGHIAWMAWRFLGEKEMLGVMHGEHYPIQQCPGAADFMFCDAWEKRRVYVIEGRSRLSQYAYGKRILYIDKQAWVVTYEDIYDQAGELWKVWI